MTDEARRKAILEFIEKHTKSVTVSKETARESLIKEGFYTKDGKLTERYGGHKKTA